MNHYLKEKRKQAGLSQRAFANLLGYSSPQFISNWERGLAAPPLSKAKEIIKHLKLSRNDYKNQLLKDYERKIDEEMS